MTLAKVTAKNDPPEPTRCNVLPECLRLIPGCGGTDLLGGWGQVEEAQAAQLHNRRGLAPDRKSLGSEL
jgi:hypothetical protein